MEDIAAVLDKAPLGFGFRPTDEELVEYLRHKLLGDDDRFNIFPEIDLCKVEPWEVPGLPMIKSDDPQRFFFSPVDYKYPNSKRVKRTTDCGFWKSTGRDRKIKVSGTDDVIWKKKTLVYYEGRVSNSVNSNWVVHEYHPDTFPENQKCFVLCHLKDKASKGGIDASICDEGEPSTGGNIASSNHENMATEEGDPPVGVLSGMNMETTFPSMHQEEIDFSPLSPISTEHEASFPSSPVDNAYFKNAKSLVQTPFETTKEENKFSTSILPPIPQSLIGTEQVAFLTSFSAHNAHSKNENCNVQTPSETNIEGNESFTFTEEDEEFFKSIFVDEDFVPIEESEHVFVNSSTQAKSLKRIHCESNDTNAEATSALNGNIVDTSAEYRISKMLKSTHGTSCVL